MLLLIQHIQDHGFTPEDVSSQSVLLSPSCSLRKTTGRPFRLTRPGIRHSVCIYISLSSHVFLTFTIYARIVDSLSEFGSTTTRDNTWQPHHSLHRPTAPLHLTLSALLAAGAHFGHSSSLLNPNFVPYAYGTRAGITIIDMEQTLSLLRRAASLVRAVAAQGGTAIFLGTRPDLRTTVQFAADRMGKQGFHVSDKWVPGTLTNKVQFFGEDAALTQRIVPDLVVVLNPLSNMVAIRECAIQLVPTIGIIDSNVDPRVVMYPIPANDENARTAELIAGVLSIAGREGIALKEEQEEKLAQRTQSINRHRSVTS